MIIRARPKYLNEINISGNKSTDNENEHFFSSGSAALKFFLQWISKEKNKEIIIGMQAFNCNVVLDAALEANCKIILSDISLECFSVTLNSVKLMINKEKIDVLLLTHYQGIPNESYEKIIKFCNQRNVLVIEDTSQTYGSYINGIKVGSLGFAALHSYAFDKPFTCMFGGSLEFNTNVNQNYKDLLKNLPTESDKEGKYHLDILSFLFKYTRTEFYKEGVENYKSISFLKKLGLKDLSVYFILKRKLFSILISKTLNLINKCLIFKNIKIKRLNSIKIGLVKKQRENFVYEYRKEERLVQFCKDNSLNYPKFNNQSFIHWNRFSFLDDSSVIKKELTMKGYQVSNYNWPITLDRLTNSNKVKILETLDNSSYASKKILNVPIWKLYEE